ncbi:MAG: T9SS type A sorting domain-containing protein [Bacteroidales bacterium]|jgi:hypothetical protein|nr:T9SS type A sorting domain-containing protein [Bacteroidales bacterium]
MKKILLLLFLLSQTLLYGQYQLSNPGFENWPGTANSEPPGWHAFNTAACDLISLMCSLGGVQNSNQHERTTDVRPGSAGQYSFKAKARSALGVIANGNLTTGQIRVGSSTPTSPENFNRTSNSYNHPFTGYPDSIYFWCKFSCPSATQQFRMNGVIHEGGDQVNNAIYTDPNQGNATYISREVAHATHESVRISENGEWAHYKAAFEYNSHNGYSKTATYILLTFTTNKVPGAGNQDDALYVDDIEMIYNARLSNITVNGTNLVGFNPDITTYSYYICSETTSSLAGIKASASPFCTVSVSQPNSLTGNVGTITVTNGPTTKVYTINFIILTPESVINTLSTTQTRCGEGALQFTSNLVNANALTRWYDTETGGEPIYTGTTFTTPTLSTTTQYWVTGYLPDGCETARVPLTATVLPTYNHTVTETACNSFLYDGITYTTTGIYPFSFQTILGCDSLVTLDLTINHSSLPTAISDSICLGNPYTSKGFDLPVQNVVGTHFYSTILSNMDNCDSVVNLSLKVKYAPQKAFTVNVCSADMPYYFNNIPFINGTHTVFVNNPEGCDSIISLTVVEHALETRDSLIITICENASYNFYGTVLTEAGKYNHLIHNRFGCDSVLIPLRLMIKDAYETPISASICDGVSYLFAENNLTTSGVYRDTVTASNNCDSIIILTLTVNMPTSYSYSAAICAGDTYNENGFYESLAGTYTQNLTNSKSCDSLVTLLLSIKQPTDSTIFAAICAGETYTLNGFNVSTAGSYSRTTINSVNCDSVITLMLTVNNSSSSSIVDQTCQGAPYSENGFSLPIQTVVGTFTHQRTIANYVNCDSVITLTLTVNPIYSYTVNHTACESFTFEDSTYTASTAIHQVYQTIHNCDSIIDVNITINHESPITLFDTTLCQGLSYTGHGFTLPAQNRTGTFTHEMHYNNSVNCDSLVRLTLVIDSSYHLLIVDSISAGHPYINHGFIVSTTDEGIYRDTLFLTSVEGCDSIVYLRLWAIQGLRIQQHPIERVTLYPNPTRHTLTVSAGTLIQQIEIYDLNGRRIAILPENGKKEMTCDMQNYQAGIYFIKVKTEKGIITKKAIKLAE